MEKVQAGSLSVKDKIIIKNGTSVKYLVVKKGTKYVYVVNYDEYMRSRNKKNFVRDKMKRISATKLVSKDNNSTVKKPPEQLTLTPAIKKYIAELVKKHLENEIVEYKEFTPAKIAKIGYDKFSALGWRFGYDHNEVIVFWRVKK